MPNLSSIFLILAISAIFLRWLTKRTNHPYPPGPKPLPIIGNARDIPKVTPWMTYTSWKKEYGNLIHISALGQHIIIINSADIALDLLEKRSHNYSDRPDIPMVQLTGWATANVGSFRYGDLWRKHRRLFHQKFRERAVPAFQPLVLRKTHVLLRNLLNSPDEFAMHLRNLPASVIMLITYGYEIEPRQDPLVTLVEDATTMMTETMLTGSQLVNIVPILRYLPEWMPGADFIRLGRKSREKVREMLDIPFNAVRQNMIAGTAVPSWTSEMLEKSDAEGGAEEQEGIIKRVAAMSFAGTTDTTASILKSFILAMTLYPEVQKRAQAEIDAVVDGERLPNFDDRKSLPFIEATLRELLRWSPPLPLGAPHAVVADDIYNGQFIPRGAIVFANLWSMYRDDSIYDKPSEFMPERFLKPDGSLTDDAVHTFGFGRRICVGRALADAIDWIAVVSILSVFDIKKAKDETGREVDVSPAYTDAAISHPLPFKCSIVPRSRLAQQLILTSDQVQPRGL